MPRLSCYRQKTLYNGYLKRLDYVSSLAFYLLKVHRDVIAGLMFEIFRSCQKHKTERN